MRRRDFLSATALGLTGWPIADSVAQQSAPLSVRQASRPNPSVLRRSRGGNLTSLDPHRPLSSADMEIAADLFVGLTAVDAAGQLVPGCASRWSIEAEGRRYRFWLSDDCMWSDGRALRSEDVQFSLRRLLAPKTGALLSYRYDAIRNARAVRRGDKDPKELGVRLEGTRQVVIELERPETDLLKLLAVAYVVPQHALAQWAEDWAKPPHMVVNGAYRPIEWRQNGLLQLVRNERYVAPRVTGSVETVTAGVHWLFGIDDATRLRLFRAGELDIAQISEASSLQLAQAQLRERLQSVPTHTGGWVGFNLRREQLANHKLRRLLALAVDRDTLCKRVRALGEAPSESLVPIAAPDYVDRIALSSESREERLQRAQALSRELGLSRRKPVRLQAIFSSNSLTQRTFLALDAMWAPFGVRLDLSGLESRAYSAALNARQFDLMDYSIFSVVQGPASFINRFRSDSFLNYFGYAKSEVDALIDEAERQSRVEARARGYLAAEQRILRDLPVIPLYSGVAHRLVSATVRGWQRNLGLATPSHYLRLA